MTEDLAAERALEALRDGTPPQPGDYHNLRRVIVAYLRSAWPSLDDHSALDIADEAIARVVMRHLHGEIAVTGRILPYALRTARNLQVDAYRRQREVPTELRDVTLEADTAVEDREVLRLLDVAASLSMVRAAIKFAEEADDVRAVAVVATWLDLAQDAERPPSSRDVGAELGIAHTTVADALSRFRNYLRAVLDAEK